MRATLRVRAKSLEIVAQTPSSNPGNEKTSSDRLH